MNVCVFYHYSFTAYRTLFGPCPGPEVSRHSLKTDAVFQFFSEEQDINTCVEDGDTNTDEPLPHCNEVQNIKTGVEGKDTNSGEPMRHWDEVNGINSGVENKDTKL